MNNTNQEIFFVVAVGGTIAFLLVGFILSLLFFYQRKKFRQAEQLRQVREDYQKELANSQIEMQESTMKHIGIELHDNIKHQLLVSKMSLDSFLISKNTPDLKTINEISNELNGIIDEIREISHSLQPDRIAYFGLLETVELELAKFKKIKSVQLKYESNLKINYFGVQKSTFIFRIFQEILQNVLKHASASELIVKMYHENEEMFCLEIEDNGIGFEINEKKHAGIGLTNIYNRAKLIGATIQLKSSIGHGTNIQLSIPIPPDEI
jgi:signal transduction histidine kinase